MNKANECTCPSGDGSLVHPCPAHPAVEQAGTNVGHGHVFPRADGVKMRCGGPALCSECAADAYRARAALAQPSPTLPPFAEKVLAKLRRFNECAEDSDSGGVDIGRHWLDLLTQLGLLNRVQRSPALWEISQQGEDLLGLDVPEIEVPDSMIEKAWQRFERTLQQLETPGQAEQAEQAEADRPEVFGLERYRVEKTEHGFWPYCVLAGDGTRELFVGHLKQCQRVATELAAAFEDGKFIAQHESIVGGLRAEITQLRQHKNDYMDAGQETYRALQNEIREREAEIARLDGLVSGRTAERDAALAQPSGEVVVTKNESGAIVSVTRQDKEGRVLSVIAESATLTAQAEQAEAERPEGPTEDELEAAGLGYPLHKEEAVKLWYSGFRSEVITVLEAWEAIGHDIGMNPDKGELLDSLRYMLEKCEAHDAALAEVAGLRSLLNSLLCYVERDIDRMRSDRDKSDNKEIYDRSISLAMERLKAAQNAVFTTEPGCDTAVELAAQTTQAQHSVPDGASDLCRFLAKLYCELDGLRYSTAKLPAEQIADALIFKWPVLQGARNQLNIKRISEQPYDESKLHSAIAAMLAAAPGNSAQHSVPELLEWAVGRWHAEVSLRPLINVHRRALDDTWRQVIRRLGGDTGLLCGPSHDELLAAAPGTEVPQAWLDVQAERRRQITAEGWTPEHDDLYCAAELPRAAAAYILSGANDEAPAIWPFSAKWWKPRDARANYMRAGALILAEIERLDRAAERGKEVGHE